MEMPVISVTRFEPVEISEISMKALKGMYELAKADNPEGKSKLGESYFYIDCRNAWTLKLIKTIAEKYFLPKEIKGVGIGYLDEGNEDVKQFLKNCFKNDLDWLWINYIALDKWEQQFRLGIDEYMDSILVALPRAKKWVGLNYFRFDSDQFSKILRVSRDVEEKIDFDNSSLKFETPLDFGTELFKIPKICMEDTFVKCKKGKEAGMRNLIMAIANSPLKDSLKEI